MPGIEVEFVEGMHVENGHFSPYLVQDTERMETVFEDPYILLTNKPMVHVQDLMPTLDAVMKSPRPLIIFAEKVDGAALGLLVQNNQHGTLKAVAVRAPGFGHRRIAHLHDLAAFTGGQVITEEAGLTLQHVTPESFGSARRVVDHRRLDGAGRGRGHAPSRSRPACRRSASSSAARPRTPTSRSCASAWPSCRAAWR